MPKPKLPEEGEAAVRQLELLHVQTLLQNLLRLVTRHRHVTRDLLVTTNGERAHSQAGSREHRLLVGQLLEDTEAGQARGEGDM